MLRAGSRPHSLATLALGLGLTATAGCAKKAPVQSESTAPASPTGSQAAALAGTPPNRAPLERIHIMASIEGVDDLFAAADAIAARTVPEQQLDTKAQLQAMLLSVGFGPGFFDNLDLNALHVAALDYPHEGQEANLSDSDFSARVATKDARRVIEAMPASVRPQPLGSGLWELTGDEPRVLLREATSALLFGLDTPDLERASGLTDEMGKGRRIRMRAHNLPKDDVDPASALGVSDDDPLLQVFGPIIQDMKGAGLEIDLGTDRNFEVVTFVEAPFSKLGLEIIGQPRNASTELERRLPPAPVAAASWSLGDAKLAHKVLDQPLDDVPEDLRGFAQRALDSAHGLVDQLTDDLVMAAYMDPKGKVAFVVSGRVKNEDRARTVLRSLYQVMADAVAGAAAKKPDSDAPKVKFKPEGVGFAGNKADQLTLRFPKNSFDDPTSALVVKNDQIEVLTMVQDGIATIAVGAGARRVMSDIARFKGKKRRTSLATEPGLEAARTGLGGCQLCVTIRPKAVLRVALEYARLENTKGGSAARKKALAAAAKKLDKTVDADNFATGMAALVAGDRLDLGWVLTKKALGAPVESWMTFKEVIEALDDNPPAQG